jgi:hypothetical protein
MPTWGEILAEVLATVPAPGMFPNFDLVRRKYLIALHEMTGRDTILYYTDWMGSNAKNNVSIVLEDMQGMMEVNKDLNGPALDLILHSPGGSAEATASIVRYLRTKFSEVRVFVPLAAMSAATMWALSADEIVMGKHSQLGPIDPQMVTREGQYPARMILQQFERAKREIAADSSNLGAWVPILQGYGPSMLQQCETAEALARGLVEEWLIAYMMKGDRRRKSKAKATAKFFSEYGANQSHSLGITRDEARSHDVRVTDLETDQALQDAVLSVHHATIHTFQGPAAKLVENHLGRAWVQMAQMIQVQVPVVAPPPMPAAGPVVPGSSTGRSER